MKKSEDQAFVRGYVTAVAEFARWHGQIESQRVLRTAGITRGMAKTAGVPTSDLEHIDDDDGWPVTEEQS